MNKQETIELINILDEKLSPQLRTMVYTEWIGVLIIILILLALTVIAWVKRKSLNEACFSDPIGTIVAWAATGFMILIFVPFVTYTIRVFTIPEIVALKSLINGG